jgi:multicomponent Na+:H+ antiporter subunit F
MSGVLKIFVVFLLLNLAAGMVRAYRGPTAADRISAALLFGSTMVAVLLVLAQLQGEAALRDVALLFVMLAAVLSVAFVGMPATAPTPVDSPGEGPTTLPDDPQERVWPAGATQPPGKRPGPQR